MTVLLFILKFLHTWKIQFFTLQNTGNENKLYRFTINLVASLLLGYFRQRTSSILNTLWTKTNLVNNMHAIGETMCHVSDSVKHSTQSSFNI